MLRSKRASEWTCSLGVDQRHATETRFIHEMILFDPVRRNGMMHNE